MLPRTGSLVFVTFLLLFASGCQPVAGTRSTASGSSPTISAPDAQRPVTWPETKTLSLGAEKVPLPMDVAGAATLGLRFHVQQLPEQVSAWYAQVLPKWGWEVAEAPAVPWEALFYRSAQDDMIMQIRILPTEVPGQSLLEFFPYQDVLARFFAEPAVKDSALVAQFPRASGEAPCTIWDGGLSLPGKCATAIMPRAANPNGRYMSPIKGPQSAGFEVFLVWQGRDWRPSAPPNYVASHTWTFELDDDGHVLRNRRDGPLADLLSP